MAAGHGEIAAANEKVAEQRNIGVVWNKEEAVKGPVPKPGPGESVIAPLTYQGDEVPRSLVATGKVKTIRDENGSDHGYFGTDFVRRDVPVKNGRGLGHNLEDHGFVLAEDPIQHPDYYDKDAVVKEYYPMCCDLVKRMTGATKVVAFDHNVRSKAMSESKTVLKGGQAVQGPAFVVHGDYTVTSAPRRLQDLAKPPKVNDTLRPYLGETPLIDPAEVDTLQAGRWAFINVWRNIKSTPVQKMPLGLCQGTSVPLDDIVTFEIHYPDRIGENYFARHSESHEWIYYPDMTRDEAILLKCWDSAGRDFAEESRTGRRVPSTFTFHSAFEDPSSLPDADDRESVEVRTLAFFPEESSSWCTVA